MLHKVGSRFNVRFLGVAFIVGLGFWGSSFWFDALAQSGDIALSPSAANGKIVYQQGGRTTSELYTITPGTGISTGLRRGFHPAYSPDGTKIVFTDNTAGATNGFLMIMNADGTNVRQLATPRQGFTPTWSPDGSRLAFIRGDFISVGDNGKGQIYIVDMTQGSEGSNEVLIPTGTRTISKPAWGSTNRIVAACYDPFSGGGTDPKGVCVTDPIPNTPAAITANPPTFTLISGQNTNDREATWSPDGSKIAFMSTRDYPMFNASEIYSANPDGSSPTRLTNTVDFKSQPTWSPDGTRIAYSRGGTQGSQNATIRTVNADGSNGTTPAIITNFGSGDVFPNWGAAVVAATPTPTPAVANGMIAFERFSDGAGVVQIYRVSDSAGATASILCGGTSESRRPAYSHDGQKLAFMRDGAIWTANADCSSQVSTGVVGDNPAWSPQGDFIVFTRGTSFTDLFVLRVVPDGNPPIKLTNIATETSPTGSFSNGQPSWGSNGKIVFRALSRKLVNGNLASVGDIWTVEGPGLTSVSGTTTFTRLTDDPVSAYAPDWSPNSSKIVFASNRATNRGEIYTMNPDGTNQTRITNNASISNSNPAWSPDGLKIVHDDDFSNITTRNADGNNGAARSIGNFPDWNRSMGNPTPTPTPTPTPARTIFVRTLGVVQPNVPTNLEIVLQGLGNESTFAFTLTFDPAKFTWGDARLGGFCCQPRPGDTLGINASQAASGRIGFLIELDAPFPAGVTPLILVRLNPSATLPGGLHQLSFGSSPTAQSVSDPQGNLLTTTYLPGTLTVPGGCTFTMNPTAQNFLAAGGTGSFSITQTSSGTCPWRAALSPTAQPFVTLNSTSGSGNGTIGFSVAPNTSAFGRSQTIEVTNDTGVRQTFTISQLTGSGPCTYAISPSEHHHRISGDGISVSITAPAGCSWTATTTDPWITLTGLASGTGSGGFFYFAGSNDAEPGQSGYRTGTINVNGQIHTATQNGNSCPLGIILERPKGDDTETIAAQSLSELSPFYAFRDEVLDRSPRGRKYAGDYYTYAGETTKLLIFDPGLLARSLDAIRRYEPIVNAVVERERGKHRLVGDIGATVPEAAIVFDSELDEVDQILASFSEQASGSLRETLTDLRNDLRNPQVHAEFGVRIVSGAKRELPSEGSFSKKLAKAAASVLDPITKWLNPKPSASAARPTNPPEPNNAPQSPAKKDILGQIPLSFEANRGQYDGSIKYVAKAAGYNLSLTSREAIISLPQRDVGATKTSNGIDTIKMSFDGAKKVRRIKPISKQAHKTNYLIGSDRTKWKTGVPNYSRIEYQDIYDGIDLVYYGNQRQLEYDFVVSPGADYKKIKIDLAGTDKIELAENGDLMLGTVGREMRLKAPFTYQVIDGVRREVPSRYLVSKNDEKSRSIRFDVDPFDPRKPLVIDPVLVYSTYLGGSGNDDPSSITVDAVGNMYVIGFTDSVNFPVAGALQSAYGGDPQDIFVSKINAAGTALVYSTYIGGNGQDNGSDIAVDADGNAYITGYTGSTNFPTAAPLQAARTGFYNAFVAKLDPTGAQFVYSTYFGGSVGEFGSAIAVDSGGNAYVGGITSSPDFPKVNSIQAGYGGNIADAFVAKFNPTGSQPVYSTLLGGNGNDGINSIAVDANGNAYVSGVTFSTDFPTTDPLQANFRGGAFDAFVTKINPAGGTLAYSTYLGGTDDDRGFRIGLDGSNNIYIAGQTLSANFPTVSAFQTTFGGGSDAFVTKFSPSWSVVYSTYIGGSGLDGATGLAISPAGNAYITGFTTSANFPLADPFQSAYNGGSFDAFVAKLNTAGSALVYSTYFGGSGFDTGFDIAIDSAGNSYIFGQTSSVDLPTANPFQPSNNGAADTFVTEFAVNSTVSGRVLTPAGLALRNTPVTLVTPDGSRRTVNTSSFGLFSFTNVPTGLGYTITINSKRYRFSPRILAVGGDTVLGDIVGLE